MKLGAEPKKVVILGVLLLVAVVVFFANSTPDGEEAPPAARPSAPTAAAQAPARPGVGVEASERPAVNRGRQAEREFRPSLRRKRNEPAPDPTSIDPTLKLDLLARLQQVNVEGVRRSIFDFGQAAPPPSETKPAVAAVKGPKAPNPLTPHPDQYPQPVASNTTPPPPQAPPVPMKFFGYVSPTKQPTKRAFFVEGEDIHIVKEGDVVKNRYKIVRIGVNSVVVEDLQFKSQQTVPLEQST
jgi:hypothetical protein